MQNVYKTLETAVIKVKEHLQDPENDEKLDEAMSAVEKVVVEYTRWVLVGCYWDDTLSFLSRLLEKIVR